MNETKTMYHAVPVVSELNRVKGFDPTRFLRKTKDGPKLDLSVKKLWFRLKYPNGRIKLSALKITDQLAIIEARVFFDKNDTQPVSSFTAQTNKPKRRLNSTAIIKLSVIDGSSIRDSCKDNASLTF